MKKALFIDRDGTIIAEPADEQIDSLEKLAFVPGAISALKALTGLGFDLVLATNQDGLGTPSFPEDTFWPAHNKMLATLGGEGVAHPITVNVADEDSVAAMASEIERVTGGLDLVVSNAGIVRAGSVLEQDASAFRLSTDINYVAFFLVTKHLGQLLARQHSTAPEWLTDIIQINSKSGLVGSNKNAAYAGSKFGGIGLVQSFALEMVAHGVKVNAICPGNFYDGPLWSDPDRGLFVQYLNSGKVPGAKTVADVKEFYEAKVPMRRGAQGIDVLRAIFYIVEQEYETGQAVPVTGGQVMLS